MAGDDLKALFLAHGQDLQAYLTRRLRDPEAAADLTQQTFVRFAERLLGATVLNARPYLYRTAHKSRRRPSAAASPGRARMSWLRRSWR